MIIMAVDLKLIRNNYVSQSLERVHYIVSSRSAWSCTNGSIDAELAISCVSTNYWETKGISKCMAGHKSYHYRYSVWIEVLALSAYAMPLLCKI